MSDLSWYRVVSWDAQLFLDMHSFEARTHKEAIYYAAVYLKRLGRPIWSAAVLTEHGRLVSSQGKLEEVSALEDKLPIHEGELGVYRLSLNREAYDLFSGLYELSHQHKELHDMLKILKQMYDDVP